MTKEIARTEDQLHKIPLRVTDTTLRDAHQSLWATRMRTDDILRIIDVIDNVGYYSLECWGGATFDVCLRFLRENPWERLRAIKAKAKNTPLQMLLRGQNLVGYRNYADDVVDRFVGLAGENGIDIFSVFDALNDTRNLEAAVRAVKKHGGHVAGDPLLYAFTGAYGGKVRRVRARAGRHRRRFALYQGYGRHPVADRRRAAGAGPHPRAQGYPDSASLPPVQRHGDCHVCRRGPCRRGRHRLRRVVNGRFFLTAAGRDAGHHIRRDQLFGESGHRRNRKGREIFYRPCAEAEGREAALLPYIDPEILIHQIPGGMISNFRSQLEMQNALDKMPQVLDEVAAVREDLGFPPLVTPTSQIVGTQAVMNILAGERYKIVPNEVKDYVRGLYGRSPSPISPAMIKTILGDEQPITGRPADRLTAMLPTATDNVDPKLIEREEDILSYLLLPEPAIEYFKWRTLPEEQRPETPADLEVKSQKTAASPAPLKSTPTTPFAAAVESLVSAAPAMIQELLQKIEGLSLDEVVFRKGDQQIAVRAAGAPVFAGSPIARNTAAPAAPSAEEKSAPAPAPAAAPAWSRTINAPLVGKFYLSPGPGKPAFVKEGDTVNAGAKVCIVEAMKLFNEITAPIKCRIVKILAADGAAVQKNTPLLAIEEVG